MFFTFFAGSVYGHDLTNVRAGGYLVLSLTGLASPHLPLPQTPSSSGCFRHLRLIRIQSHDLIFPSVYS